MPYRPRRRELSVTLSPLHLTGCIALGMWLGFVAIALTCWLAYKVVFNSPLPLSSTAESPEPPAVAQPAPESPMFEQYKENLYKQELQQAENQARNNERNQSKPKCQFWLQQNQTAPSDKSRANVLKFCD
ncbi:hypothetical protein [Pseudomonas akapageensis]|uniref:hypothetical protein n=1 Tax=Pseudomonas akapageensis TaxID=2609961 RepID=UPI001408E538|nr:hypothetical protein [Pseudomonas akapageensis]